MGADYQNVGLPIDMPLQSLNLDQSIFPLSREMAPDIKVLNVNEEDPISAVDQESLRVHSEHSSPHLVDAI